MADVSSDMWGGRNWRELKNWRVSGFKPGFLKDFTYSSGRFTAKTSGVYSFHANIRMDSANTGYFRLVIAKRGNLDVNNGLHAMNSDPSDNYNTINVGGKMKMNQGDVSLIRVPAPGSCHRRLEHAINSLTFLYLYASPHSTCIYPHVPASSHPHISTSTHLHIPTSHPHIPTSTRPQIHTPFHIPKFTSRIPSSQSARLSPHIHTPHPKPLIPHIHTPHPKTP